jgi:RNA-directed DNA polymerase
MVWATPTPSCTLSVDLSRSDEQLQNKFNELRTKDDVADLLEIPADYLRYILYRRRDRLAYRTFTIPKRSGGQRVISAPPPALEILQQKLNRILQLVYRSKPCVHGFIKGRSILTNAVPHVGKTWVLNIDLQAFFPAINFGRVRGALMAHPYELPKAVATIIAQICTADGALPQGAPTSPILANIVAAKLDGDLTVLARRFRLSYTRYCDDLTFSCRRNAFPQEIAASNGGWIGENVVLGAELESTITNNGFHVNTRKSRLQFRAAHQEVTGLTVNEFPNVTREYVRQIRGMTYAWKRHGLDAAARVFVSKYGGNHLGHLSPTAAFTKTLRGRLEYVGFVKGRRDPVYCKLRNDVHAVDPTLIKEADVPAPYRLPMVTQAGDRWTRQFSRFESSVFQLEVIKPNREVGHGTAFALTPHSLTTAAHNLVGEVTIHDLTASFRISEAQVHPNGAEAVDAALLPYSHGMTAMPFDRRLPRPGEEIAIIGFASMPGRHPTLGLYVGNVEAVSPDYTRTTTFIHVSVASAGGLSGAPVIDNRGRLVGIVVHSIFEETADRVQPREYCTVLPIRYVLEIGASSPLVSLPIRFDH